MKEEAKTEEWREKGALTQGHQVFSGNTERNMVQIQVSGLTPVINILEAEIGLL